MRFDIHCLQHLALVKVTLTLCKLSDIKRELTWWYYSPEENINRILFTMTKVISSMDIALLLKKKLLRCFASIVFDYKMFANTLSNGIHYHRLYAAEHFRSMCWTAYGAIDAQKSVASLIRNRKIPLDGRFHLACKYCFKEDILSLWNQMPILQQDWFMHVERSDKEWVDWLAEGYTPSWPNSMEDYHFKEIFKRSFRNSTAVQNLLEMLPPEERHRCEVKLLGKKEDCITNINYFQLDTEEPNEYLHANYAGVLMTACHWTSQMVFRDFSNRIYSLFDGDTFVSVLVSLIISVHLAWGDLTYSSLTKEFWRNGPVHLREYFREMQRDEKCREMRENADLYPEVMRVTDGRYDAPVNSAFEILDSWLADPSLINMVTNIFVKPRSAL